MTKKGEEKRISVFFVDGKYEPETDPEKKYEYPRLFINEGDLRLLSRRHQKFGIRYIPQRWLKHKAFENNHPHLFLRMNILGIIVPFDELEKIRKLREEIVLLESLLSPGFEHSRYPELVKAVRNFNQIWEKLKTVYEELTSQLEIARKKEKAL